MNAREKKLAIITGTLVFAVVGGLLVHQLILKPWRKLNDDLTAATLAKYKLIDETSRGPSYDQRLDAIAKASLGWDRRQVSEAAQARLLKYLTMANLSTTRFTLTPVTGSRLAKQYQEIGWHIHGKGKLEAVVDFLYLLQSDPYVHTLSNLSLTYSTAPYEVDLKVRWMTLAVPPRGEIPQGQLPESTANPLNEPGRTPYQLIVSRDLFRPYMPKRQPRVEIVQAQSQTRQRTDPTPDNPSATSRPMLQLVGLPTWGGTQRDPQVILRDTQTGRTTRLKVGDELAGGRIVTVDYRPMPLPDQPQIISPSRVIFERDGAFWAIELGHYDKDKYLLPKDRLPAELVSQAALEP